MPNHFHLLLYQYETDGITRLMRSIGTGYSIYFNKRNKRVGPLFQGRYKASPIKTQAYWDHISRYIHLNPIDIGRDYKAYTYSSYRNYIGEAKTSWVKPDMCISGFQSSADYAKFVSDYVPYRDDIKIIKDILANSRELEA